MEREDIHIVISAFFDPYDKDNPGHPNNWVSAPVEAVRSVLAKKNIKWSDENIMIIGAMLVHPSNDRIIKLVRNIFEAEVLIRDAREQVNPAYRSTLIMHNVTFYLGIVLILSAVYSAYMGSEFLSAIFGSIGIATIISLFLKDPVKGLHQSIGNLIQLEIIFNSYARQLGYWKVYENIDNKKTHYELINEIELCTKRTVYLIQEYCETEPKDIKSLNQIADNTIKGD
jgi:hypothetical protein